MIAAIETRDLRKSFGGIRATDGVNFTLEPGARHALIGPNGAGKTTLVNLLTGILQPTAGVIRLHGQDITTLPTHRRVKAGLARTFQINQLVPEFTPLDTVMLAIAERRGRTANWWRPVAAQIDLAEEASMLLARCGLAAVARQPVSSLAYGQQRMLEIAVALAAGPKVLLLDEPAAGVAEAEREEILNLIEGLPAEVTLLLIDHDMDLVFRFARTVSVMVDGAIFVEGAAATVASDPRVRQVYLGEERDG